MVIFAIIQTQNLIQTYTKTHQIAPFKNFFRGSMPPNPPSKARRFAPRVTSRKRDVYSPQYYPPHVSTWIYALACHTGLIQVHRYNT